MLRQILNQAKKHPSVSPRPLPSGLSGVGLRLPPAPGSFLLDSHLRSLRLALASLCPVLLVTPGPWTLTFHAVHCVVLGGWRAEGDGDAGGKGTGECWKALAAPPSCRSLGRGGVVVCCGVRSREALGTRGFVLFVKDLAHAALRPQALRQT